MTTVTDETMNDSDPEERAEPDPEPEPERPEPRSPYDTLRDPAFWLFRVFPLRLVVPAVLFAAALAWVVLAITSHVIGAVAAGVVAGLILLVPVRERTLVARIAGALGRRRDRKLPANWASSGEPFDVPVSEGGGYGMRWDGEALVTMLRIDPPPDSLTLLRPGALDTDQLLPLAEVARCLDQFDLELAGIDLISTGARTAGTGVAAQLYERILGPLPAIAHRTVWLVLRLNPLLNADAVEKRGGGSTGSLRAAIIATRRVANRLAALDIATSVLSAAELTAALRRLTHGTELDEVVETPKGLRSGDRHLALYRVEAEAVQPEGLAAIWALPSLSTTVTLRLRPGAHKPETRPDLIGTVLLEALVRIDTATEPEEPPLPSLRPLPGRQLRALTTSIPLGDAGRTDPADAYRGTLTALTGIAVPTAGCGQLIGADERGRGIAVPLIGEGTRHVEVVGNLDLAQQVVLRAIALGAHGVVHTSRPERWQTMVTALDTPGILTIAPRAAGASYHPSSPPPRPAAPYPSTTVLVFDGVPPTTHAGGATIVHVRDEGEPAPLDADITLIQDPAAPNRITVRTGTAETTVSMVTTPAEMEYIGESLAAR
ncbi:type VII secretion protein EccE [Nocardia harenae]|uniref:type VII secretion protein EccE n=1 Tax=Nocardia harenae TaxID=358707 RepID=UPI000B0F68CA|nr:type VII secretion protein EccE [Nocardia harenae]